MVTFTCINITWVFFRAESFETAKNMISSMLYLNPDGAKVLGQFDIIKVFTVITILFLCHWVMRNTSVKSVSEKTPSWLLGIIWAIMFVLIAIAQGTGEQFIYFQF